MVATGQWTPLTYLSTYIKNNSHRERQGRLGELRGISVNETTITAALSSHRNTHTHNDTCEHTQNTNQESSCAAQTHSSGPVHTHTHTSAWMPIHVSTVTVLLSLSLSVPLEKHPVVTYKNNQKEGEKEITGREKKEQRKERLLILKPQKNVNPTKH